MKKTINYTAKGENDVITIAMKRQFPWWLLLLIPLILLIPVKRDMLNQIMEGETGIALSQTPVAFSYNDIGIFGARTPQTASDTTDNDGKCEVRDVSEPLWYYLFVDSETLHITTINDCPKLTDYQIQYKEYKRGEYKVIKTEVSIIDATFTVIDKKTREPLPGATVTVEIINNGESTSQEFTSDANGKVTATGLSSCYKINVKGEKENYTPDFINDLPVSQIPDMSEEDRTLELGYLIGQGGALRINLQWNTQTDLDLLIVDPCGNSIVFDNKKADCKGNIGELDVDANYEGELTDTPQENIFWGKASPGKYRIFVLAYNHERDCDNNPTTDFNVSIISTVNGEQHFENIPGTMPKDKLINRDQRIDFDNYFVHEIEVY